MNRDDLNRLAIVASARTEGDVRPEDVTALRVEIPGGGWTTAEQPQRQEWNGLQITGAWTLVFLGWFAAWTVLLVGLWALWSGAWRVIGGWR